jgi:hypothetical protein
MNFHLLFLLPLAASPPHNKMSDDSDRVFVCPARYTGHSPAVFLAGGITGCRDWQSLVKQHLLEKCPRLVILNPRRATFDVTDQSASEEQIRWENDALHQASLILFWFPHETLCPTTLFELGTWSVLHKTHGNKIIVGCHPDYKLRADVERRLEVVMGPGAVKVHTRLEELVDFAQEWWENRHEHLPGRMNVLSPIQSALDYLGDLEPVFSTGETREDRTFVIKYDAPLDTQSAAENAQTLAGDAPVRFVFEFVKDGRKNNKFYDSTTPNWPNPADYVMFDQY